MYERPSLRSLGYDPNSNFSFAALASPAAMTALVTPPYVNPMGYPTEYYTAITQAAAAAAPQPAPPPAPVPTATSVPIAAAPATTAAPPTLIAQAGSLFTTYPTLPWILAGVAAFLLIRR